MKRFYFFLFCALIGVQVFAQNKWAKEAKLIRRNN